MFVHMLILATSYNIYLASGAHIECNPKHHKIGCFKRMPSLLPDLLVNDRDKTHANYSGIIIDWHDYGNYLHSLACRCEQKARGHYNFFAIGFYGECYAGRDLLGLERIMKFGLYASSDCVNGEYASCDIDSREECAGKAKVEYIYIMDSSKPKCTFKNGDGKARKEVYAGFANSREECVRTCFKYREEDPDVNGVTMKSTGRGSCYCEVAMTGRYSGNTWISCMFE